MKVLVILLLVSVVSDKVISEICSYYQDLVNGNFFKCDTALENVTALFVTDIPKSEIKVLNRKILEPFKNLLYIDIGKCDIETVANDSFQGRQLKLLHLNNNKIKKIDNGTLNSLNATTSFEITFNLLEALEADTFLGMTSLSWMSLSANKIERLDVDAFKGLENLEALFLASNKIENLEADTFKHLRKLTLLDISQNLVKQLPYGIFAPLQNVNRLLLEHNSIERLPDRIFDKLTALSTLDISQNKIFQIQDTLFGQVFENFFVFKMYSNKISGFNATTFFKRAPRIKEIELYDNPWRCAELERLRNEFLNKKLFIPLPIRVQTKPNIDGIACVL